MPNSHDDPVLVSARREGLVVLVVWLVAMAYTVGYCYLNGYNRTLESLTFVWGIPDWIFWGIVVPWLTCVLISWIFSYMFMTDAHLGEENEEAEEGLDV